MKFGSRRLFVVMADAIRASADTSFATVHYDCATGYYSFGHEIGHLQGARHNTEADSSTSPFTYGHGFHKNSDWRTVMAYNCSPSCPRIQYWSNPSVSYSGSAMGTVAVEDNARVLNTTASAVATFRNPDGTIWRYTGWPTLANGPDSGSMKAILTVSPCCANASAAGRPGQRPPTGQAYDAGRSSSSPVQGWDPHTLTDGAAPALRGLPGSAVTQATALSSRVRVDAGTIDRPMKFLFDFLPDPAVLRQLQVRGSAPRVGGGVWPSSQLGFLVSGGVVGREEAPVLLATVVVIVATLVQVCVLKLRAPAHRHDAVGQPRAGGRAGRR